MKKTKPFPERTLLKDHLLKDHEEGRDHETRPGSSKEKVSAEEMIDVGSGFSVNGNRRAPLEIKGREDAVVDVQARTLAQAMNLALENGVDSAVSGSLLVKLTEGLKTRKFAELLRGDGLNAASRLRIHLEGRTDITSLRQRSIKPEAKGPREKMATAIVYCEANFGAIDGKTANGLVRHSETYRILSIVDSAKAGLDAGVVLDGEPNGIPVLADLADALTHAGIVPDYFIYGMAPSSGRLSPHERGLFLLAMGLGMGIVNGLHEFLSDDSEFSAMSAAQNVEILDVRKPRPKDQLRMFSGRIAEVTCPRIAILGTDCAVGKRTTATILTRAMNDLGVKAVLVGTGQTGLMQGARYGVALDAIPSQFCAGEMEASILEAFENESPDVIFIEGQGALSHPAFSTSSFILRGSCPHGVVLQHAPGRVNRCDFDQMAMPTPETEIHLIETFSDTTVIGIAINHESMSVEAVDAARTRYESNLGIPATDPLTESPERLMDMVFLAFPELKEKQTVGVG